MLTRRRFLSIAAATAMLPLDRASSAGRHAASPVIWRGTAMGAEASISIVHPDRRFAQQLILRSVSEIDRLEGIFSLYRGDSALYRLNAEGMLEKPPLELVELLGFALGVSRQSAGAFDPTVQPLFRLYADHFAVPDAAPSGPAVNAIEAVLERVGYRHVEFDGSKIRLARPGMGITLNGIAQGYVTDRVADLLKGEGLSDVLLNLGEARALGSRGGDTPWRAAIADPRDHTRTLLDLRLSDRDGLFPALSTSAGSGMTFDEAGRHHHLFDPRTGRSARRNLSVSVAADRAVLADALSTALSVLSRDEAVSLLSRFGPARAYFMSLQGHLSQLDAT
jgi:thiamine biosynthesis lipoprotein